MGVMMAKKLDQEQELDITFTVRIKMFGKAPKHVDDAGETLAKLCGLNFGNAQVRRGKTSYWHETMRSLDVGNDTDVTSGS